jgi:hypothetical protein
VPAPRKYSQELRDRSLRLVSEAMAEDPSLSMNQAMKRIGERSRWCRTGSWAGSSSTTLTPGSGRDDHDGCSDDQGVAGRGDIGRHWWSTPHPTAWPG